MWAKENHLDGEEKIWAISKMTWVTVEVIIYWTEAIENIVGEPDFARNNC